MAAGLWIRDRERDHRPYRYLVTDSEELATYLTNFHVQYPDSGIRFWYHGMWMGEYEFNMNNSEGEVDPSSLKYDPNLAEVKKIVLKFADSLPAENAT